MTAHLSPPKILRLKQVLALTGLGRTSIYNRLNPKAKSYDPAFPRPVRLSNCPGKRGAIGFLESEILAWIDSRVAARCDETVAEQSVLLNAHDLFAGKTGVAGRRRHVA